MALKWTRFLALISAAALVSLVPSGPAFASCASSAGVTSLDGFFTNCGDDAAAFSWLHQRAVQRIMSAGSQVTSNSTPGVDTGALQTVADGGAIITPGPDPQSYSVTNDIGNFGMDGCSLIPVEGALSTCTGAAQFFPIDFAIAGSNPAALHQAVFAAATVDFNEIFQAWFVSNAGGPTADGDFCAGDALSFGPPVSCMPIPVPHITGSTSTPTGADINLQIDDVSALVGQAMVDDCLTAEDRTTNCPRGFYAGRQLFFKRVACTTGTQPPLPDTRTFVYPAYTAAFQTIAPNWIPYSAADLNLNGIQDGGEGPLTPTIFGGTAATSTTIPVQANIGANDCILLAMGIRMDASPNATGCGGPCEPVVSPRVSVNRIPIRAGTATPVTDQVYDLRAAKAQGQTAISWSTTGEFMTAGFNLYGGKKGSEVKINDSQIAPKEGTSGNGASYMITVGAGQLKGATSVIVEVVKTNGTSERFGPASVK